MLYNLPNVLTLSRIGVIPILVAFLWIGGDAFRWAALSLYVLACVTDYLDGYLARSMNQRSDVGRLFDPIADKLLVGACLLVLCALGHIEGWAVIAALIILLREILVSGLREFLAEIHAVLPVSRLAKWKTTIQMLAIGFLIVGSAGPAILPTVLIGEVGLAAAAVITLITGYDYLRSGLLHLGPAEMARRKQAGKKPSRPAGKPVGDAG